MKRRKPTTLPIGSISSGTMRAEDLIQTFLNVLDDICLTKDERNRVRAIVASGSVEEGSDTAEDDLQELFDILDNHCPDYCYFGAHPGDGANYGVWISWESIEDNKGTTELTSGRWHPSDWRERTGRPGQPSSDHGAPHYLQVNDHGNATLYRRVGDSNRWREVWSVV